MIKLERPIEAPSKLVEGQTYLNNLILDKGDISHLSEDECDNVNKFYRHEQVKTVLFETSHFKCAYCETISTGNYLEVEHFRPKSIYRDLTLEWSNLLPSCKKCNLKKRNFDTGLYPIIDPYVEDPENFLKYEFLSIKSSDHCPDRDKTKRTIDLCGLNRPELLEERIRLLRVLTEYSNNLQQKINNYIPNNTSLQNFNILINIKNSLEIITQKSRPEENYSGLCRYYIRTSEDIQNAISIVNENPIE